MKKVLGWIGFAALSPFIGCGVVAYFVADACVFGWNMAEKMLEDWDD